MGRLSTHVLDTSNGRPAEGMRIALYRIEGDGARTLLKSVTTNADGRVDGGALLADGTFTAGTYELVFGVGAYFAESGTAMSEPPFLGEVPLRFGVASAAAHYHVPLLVSPWSYSTYRGS